MAYDLVDYVSAWANMEMGNSTNCVYSIKWTKINQRPVWRKIKRATETTDSL